MHRMFRGACHGGLDGGRHDGCCQDSICASRVNNLCYAEFLVIVFAFGLFMSCSCLQASASARYSERAQAVSEQPQEISARVHGFHNGAPIYTAKAESWQRRTEKSRRQ